MVILTEQYQASMETKLLEGGPGMSRWILMKIISPMQMKWSVQMILILEIKAGESTMNGARKRLVIVRIVVFPMN